MLGRSVAPHYSPTAMNNDQKQTELSPIVKQALEAAAEAPDIPKDFDDMSSEDWTALNEWLVKVGKLLT